MSVFLVLCSLSVACYLFVLLALYRDNHKRRGRRIQVYSNVCFDKATDQKVSHPGGYTKARRVNFSDDVLWLLVTKVQLKRETGGATSTKRTPAVLTVRHGSAGH